MKWLLGVLLIPSMMLLLAYTVYRDTYSLETKRYVVSDPGLGRTLAGLRIALLADLHVGRPAFLEEQILLSIERERPDLILLAGDYIPSRGSYKPVLGMFRGMRAPLGTFAVLGNMDYTNEKGSCILCHDRDRKSLQTSPHPVFLRNAVRKLEWKGRPFYIAGMDDPVTKRRAGIPSRDLGETLGGTGSTVPILLLAHSPEVFEAAEARGVDLVLSGHNHGGQIAFSPSMSRIYPFEPALRYSGGFFRREKSILYVSRGIGTSLLPFRIGVRPEITYLDFAQGADPSTGEGYYRDVSRKDETVHPPFRRDLLKGMFDFGHHFGWDRRREKKRSSPVLFSFEDDSELEGMSRECHVWQERQRRHATDGEYSLKIEFSAGESRRIEFTGFRPDWSGAKRLKMDFFNPQAAPVQVWLRVDDLGAPKRSALHCDRPLVLQPGLNHLSIGLDSLVGNATREPLDLKQIERIIFYSQPSRRGKELYLDAVRLDSGPGNPAGGETGGR